MPTKGENATEIEINIDDIEVKMPAEVPELESISDSDIEKISQIVPVVKITNTEVTEAIVDFQYKDEKWTSIAKQISDFEPKNMAATRNIIQQQQRIHHERLWKYGVDIIFIPALYRQLSYKLNIVNDHYEIEYSESSTDIPQPMTEIIGWNMEPFAGDPVYKNEKYKFAIYQLETCKLERLEQTFLHDNESWFFSRILPNLYPGEITREIVINGYPVKVQFYSIYNRDADNYDNLMEYAKLDRTPTNYQLWKIACEIAIINNITVTKVFKLLQGEET